MNSKNFLAPKLWPAALVLCGLVSLAAAPPVSAQKTAAPAAPGAAVGPITVELKAFKVVRDEAGKEGFRDASRAAPGDTIEYRAVYANVSRREVKNLQANLPIPAATQLLPDSALPKTALASADARTFAAMPLMQSVTLPTGTVRRPLPLSAYRALRWPLGTLAAGQSVIVRARVRLDSTSSSSGK